MLTTMRVAARSPWLSSLLLAAACRGPEAKRCLTEFDSAQAVVMQVQSNDVNSVETSVKAVEGALAACREADRSSEVAELEKAQRMLSTHLERLREHLAKPKQEPLSAEEVARRAKNGDPNCPRGQAYMHKQSNTNIRCTGPVPIEMTFAEAEKYFAGRGYKLDRQASPKSLTVEFGAEKQIFRYADADAASPPRCIVSYPPPGVTWQEATARLTGVAPNRLDLNKPVKGRQGDMTLRVDEGENKLIVSVGECG
jgi:cell fate (sporulation/competence/biofilm development) regulator YlbF (YheA/YmcA/DUF963 family)